MTFFEQLQQNLKINVELLDLKEQIINSTYFGAPKRICWRYQVSSVKTQDGMFDLHYERLSTIRTTVIINHHFFQFFLFLHSDERTFTLVCSFEYKASINFSLYRTFSRCSRFACGRSADNDVPVYTKGNLGRCHNMRYVLYAGLQNLQPTMAC